MAHGTTYKAKKKKKRYTNIPTDGNVSFNKKEYRDAGAKFSSRGSGKFHKD